METYFITHRVQNESDWRYAGKTVWPGSERNKQLSVIIMNNFVSGSIVEGMEMFLLEGNPSPPGEGQQQIRAQCSRETRTHQLFDREFHAKACEAGAGELWTWKLGEAAATSTQRDVGSRRRKGPGSSG